MANVCSIEEPALTSPDLTIVRAADLAERVVDEISEADQDWYVIEAHARELVELLARRAAATLVAPVGARLER